MIAFLVPIIVGIILVFFGIRNMKGDIRSVHWYHRQRVSEEDKAAFGKRMGIASILCGAGPILFGILALVTEITAQPVWITAGAWLTIACLAAGVGMMIHATMKYNKGVF